MAQDVADAAAQMRQKGRYRELLLIVETCQAATLYSKIKCDAGTDCMAFPLHAWPHTKTPTWQSHIMLPSRATTCPCCNHPGQEGGAGVLPVAFLQLQPGVHLSCVQACEHDACLMMMSLDVPGGVCGTSS